MSEVDKKLTKSTKKKKKIKQKPVASDMRSHASEYFSMMDVQNKDPNFYYRWVNKKGNEVERRKAMGYVVVSGSMREKAMTMGTTVRENPDAILMRVPTARAVAIHRRAVERSNNRTKSLTTKKNQKEILEERLKQDGILDRLIKLD